mgnify:CR=1 FL=1
MPAPSLVAQTTYAELLERTASAAFQDAFADKSPINPSTGGRAKKYDTAAATVVAVVTDSKNPDMGKLSSEAAKLEQQLRTRKVRELEEEWIQELRGKASIHMNPAIVNGPEPEKDVG